MKNYKNLGIVAIFAAILFSSCVKDKECPKPKKEETTKATATDADGKSFELDAKFAEVLKTLDDGKLFDKDNKLVDAEAKKITELNLSSKEIENLKGIEKFEGLTKLNVSTNKLKALDVKANTKLEDLNVSSNALATLDVKANTKLKDLNVSGNRLTALDVKANTALMKLDASSNKLSSLDVAKNTALNELYVEANQMGLLVLTENKELTKLNASQNVITQLDVKANTKLEDLNVSNNQITTITLDDSLDGTIKKANLSNNALTALPFTGAKSGKVLEELNISKQGAEDANKVMTYSLGAESLKDVTKANFPALKKLDVSSNQNVSQLGATASTLNTDLDMLEELNVSQSKIVKINTAGLTKLKMLNISNLTAISTTAKDVKIANATLEVFIAKNLTLTNQIGDDAIKFSAFTQLKEINLEVSIAENENIDLSKATAKLELVIVKGLNIGTGTLNLKNGKNDNIKVMDATSITGHSTAIKNIIVDDVAASKTRDGWKVDADKKENIYSSAS